MAVKEFLTGVLSKTLNIDESGVASLFNEDGSIKDDAEQTILDWDAKRVIELKTGSQKTSFDDGYKKAQSEVLSKFEIDLKAKTGFKSEKKGVELVMDYANSVKSTDGTITDDVIKKHPMYLSLQEEKEAAIIAAKTEGEAALNQFKTEISKKEVRSIVAKKALELFHAEKPVLSTDPIKAKRQEDMFLKEFFQDGLDYEVQGERIVVLKEGKVHENAQGHAVKFEEMTKQITHASFDVHAVTAKSSPANQNKTGDAAKTFNFEVPKTKEDYAKAISDPSKSLEEKNAIDKAWSEQQTT